MTGRVDSILKKRMVIEMGPNNPNYSDYMYNIQHKGLNPIWQENEAPNCTKEHIWLEQNLTNDNDYLENKKPQK